MKTLVIRTITGAIFVAVITLAIIVSPYSFLGLFILIVGISLWEFYDLVRGGKGDIHIPNKTILYDKKTWQKLFGIGCGIYLFTASFFYASGMASGIIYLPYILFLLVYLIDGLYRKNENPVNEWAIALFSQFYCAGLLSLLNFIAFNPSTKIYGYAVLLIFFFVWINDTGAYLVGTTFGKHKLFPRISPLKSWEGFWGGLVTDIIASLFLAHYFPQIAWYHWLAIAVIIVVFGTWGDLIESLIKRTYGAKDSGSLLPGHGGILDRMDSVLLAAPAVYLYLEFFIRN